MKKFLLLLFLPATLQAADTGFKPPSLTISEVDGNPKRREIQELVMPNGSVSVSGSKATITLSGMAPGATYYIQVSNSLQSGATFYVSSGTATNFNVGQILRFGTSIQSYGGGSNGTVGNARGDSAVDLQTYRNTANQVASGDRSVIGGGLFNRTAGEAAVISGGWQNQSLGLYDTVCGGNSNLAFATASTVAGGDTNDAHANYSAIMGGQNNTANGAYDSIIGGLGCTLSGANSLCYSTMTMTVSGSNVAVFKGVKMGIDITAPVEQLEVNGNVKLANSLDIASAPSASGVLGITSANVVYVSTGTGAGAWVKVGSQ